MSTLAKLQAKLVAAQNCHANAVPHLIEEALDLLDEIARHEALQPAQAAADARDAKRYRWLRRKACIIGGFRFSGEVAPSTFEFVNLPYPRYVAPDAAIELDAAIDAALATHQQRQDGGEG